MTHARGAGLWKGSGQRIKVWWSFMAYYEVGPFFPLLMMNLGIFAVAQGTKR